MNELKVTKDLENKTLTLTRDFDGSIDKVWRAFADKETFEKWWGPEGWETTTTEFDFTPGGRVHYGMKCVDEDQGEWFGQSSWGMMLIDSVDAPNRFTYRDYFSDESGTLNQDMPTLSVTNQFVEENGKTKFTSVSQAESADQIEELLKMGMVEGFTSQLSKLDAMLAA